MEVKIMSPAVSKKQRKLAGMTLAAKKGKGPMLKTEMVNMSVAELEEYAGTPTKDLPEKVRLKGKKKGKK